MPLLSCSWATSSVRAPWSGSGKRCHAEWSLPVAFDKVLREAIFPVGLTRCGADVWVLIKAWGIRFCRAMGSTVNCAAAEKLKLESCQLLSGWLYNAGRQLGQGSKRSQVLRHQELRQKKHMPIQNISYGLYFCKRCQKWGTKTALQWEPHLLQEPKSWLLIPGVSLNPLLGMGCIAAGALAVCIDSREDK